MNERFPMSSESHEGYETWRAEKDEAPARAESLLASRGFDEAATEEKVTIIDALLSELEFDNANRFVYRVLSLRREQLVLTSEYEARMRMIESSIAA